MPRKNSATTTSVQELMSAQEANRAEMQIERAALVEDVASHPKKDNSGKSDRIRSIDTALEISGYQTSQLQTEFNSLAGKEGMAHLESLYRQMQSNYRAVATIDDAIAQYKTNIAELLKNRKDLTEAIQLTSGRMSKHRATLRQLPDFNDLEGQLAKRYSVQGYS